MKSPSTTREGAQVAASPPLLIIAAGGSLPRHVAKAGLRQGRSVFVVAIDGEADPAIAEFPHEMMKWGQIGRLRPLIERHGMREAVLVGSIAKRPDFRNIGFDPSTLKLLPQILKSLNGGDDAVLRNAVRILEEWGLKVVGAHEVATDLVAAAGPVGGPAATTEDLADAGCAMRAAAAIGALDIGQAAIAVRERVVALEAAEGTDAIVRRVGDLRAAGRFKWSGRSGVLAKCAKPAQDLRVDMPTIGPRTVELVAEIGLAGIVIEAGRVMIAEREATVAAAARTRTFIHAMPPAALGRTG